jgi:aryl carrier-like protein
MAAMGDELQTVGAVESYLSAIRDDVALVLAIDSVDRADDQTNLFAMGMDSMTAIELVARLRDRFGLPIRVTTLLEACTISDLAKLVMTSGQGR